MPRTSATLACLAAIFSAITLIPPAAAVPPATATASAVTTAPRSSMVSAATPKGRFAIGDSVMLGAKPNLAAHGFTVDAKVSRQFFKAPGLLRARGSALPRNVVVALGTNGNITLRDCKAVVTLAGPSRRVFFVNNKVPRSWESANNAMLARCDAAFERNRVGVIDWKAYSAGQFGWFGGDGIHLTGTGRRAYASLIDAVVDTYGLR